MTPLANRVRISRAISLPDRLRLARYHHSPELGPRILFFSGGTALAPLSRAIIDYTHNSVHLITPFDSGGSSAEMRRCFQMLGVGDLRNRLMALCDRSVGGNPEIVRLFAHRLPKDLPREDLARALADLVRGHDPLMRAVPDPMRKIIRTHLGYFSERMPEDFDLRGASVGNMVLTGGFLTNGRHIDPVIYLFSKLAEVRGIVRPVVNQDLHLAAELADGSLVVGQHNLTGREVPAIASPIQRLYLTRDQGGAPVEASIREKVKKLIAGAELIVFPMGSFFTSLLATLLPQGVGKSVRDTDCPKVYIPNVEGDTEQLGQTVASSLKLILHHLRKSCDGIATTDQLVNLVLVDSKNAVYPGGGKDLEALKSLGVSVIDTQLVTPESKPYLDPAKIIEVLLSLV